ncbi:hypothetical protein SteCoe_18070 [Stentor coeruleus]|uniref:U2A'/phosphoprotein 32 family A C-terminal domain-containing protein n=1 Tax=Stentor coeruleus TaxID=5963 RepID=A0A1R2BXC4_9CILI|nr:hypothetical protein SteCoe_18070 [Stentor coeruleus]
MLSNRGVNSQNVMSRMEWFRDLKIIYNKLISEEDILTPLDKQTIIKELNSRASNLDLKDPEEYYKKSKVQAFSLDEILTHINSLEEQSINFDQLIDSLIYLSIEKKRKEKKPEILPVKSQKAEILSSQSPNARPSNPTFSNPLIINPQNFRKPNEKIISLSKIRKISPEIIKEPIKDINKPKLYCDTPTRSPTMDLSFPESKYFAYPELKNQSNLQYLSLAGNSIENTKYAFPQSLIVLNLASNRISEVNFESDLPNLSLLNLANNQIFLISSTSPFKNLKEFYLANNYLTTINLFCHLSFLTLLDTSNNEIDTFEDIAGLVISKKIGILKLKGNPLSSKPNYEKIVNSLLPRIYCLDPLNIVELSAYKNLGSLPFLSTKNLLDEAQDKNMNKIRSEVSLEIKEKQSFLGDYSPMEKQKSSKITNTPTFTMNLKDRYEGEMKRSSSQNRFERVSVLTNTTKTSIDFTDHEEFSKKSSDCFLGQSIMDMAERRIKVFKQENKGRGSISVISNESIQNMGKKVYGNPIAAMMIGPPAVMTQKMKGSKKSPAYTNLDLFKKRRFK